MMIWKSIAAVALCGICSVAEARQSPATPTQSQPPSQTQSQSQQPAPDTDAPPSANPNTKVIFSRSDNDTDPEKPAAAPRPEDKTPVAKVSDQERAAVTFTAYDLDIHLTPQQHTISARARLDLRNDSDQPLSVIPLQLSSALNFEDIILNGKRLKFGQQILNSDVDHTGQLREAVVELPEPLAPKAEIKLDAVYSGTIEPSARRLEQLGTPADLAARSDWDEISADFVGLRGFGNVVWYPVSSVPALFGDGAKVFTEIAAQKSRQSGATLRMQVSAEFFDIPPTVAVLDGQVQPIAKPSAMAANGFPGVVTCTYGPTPLGFNVPTIFLANRALREGNGLRIYARPEDEANTQGYMTAATMVQPLLQQWLSPKSKQNLAIIDLPEAEDASFQQGDALFTSLAGDAPEKLAPQLAYALAHVYFQSPRQWLDEGVPSFAESLWIEHTHDRGLALQSLESNRGALAFAEPATPGAGPGQDLLHASDTVYYRTKATYVLWMLRDVSGDKQLAAALQAYDPAADTTPEYFQHLVERPNGVDPAKDLKWFFDNWVYRDRGLPDLSIAAVHFSTAAQTGEYLVGIDILNDGFAEVEIPVTVRSQSGTLTERVRLPGKTRTAHRMLVQGTPLEVIVNDGTVPEVQATIHQRDLTDQPAQ
jgi:hypothetical protein